MRKVTEHLASLASLALTLFVACFVSPLMFWIFRVSFASALLASVIFLILGIVSFVVFFALAFIQREV